MIGAILAMLPCCSAASVLRHAHGAAQYSWFIGCGVAFVVYWALVTKTSLEARRELKEPVPERRLTRDTRYGPTFHNWNVGPYDFPVSLRIAALGLLAQHPGSGYDLLKRFEKSMANVWPATQSQLYGELNKLADAGLIEVSDDRSARPQGVSGDRRRPCRAGCAGSPTRATIRRSRRPDCLRVFLLSEVPAEDARTVRRGLRRSRPRRI